MNFLDIYQKVKNFKKKKKREDARDTILESKLFLELLPLYRENVVFLRSMNNIQEAQFDLKSKPLQITYNKEGNIHQYRIFDEQQERMCFEFLKEKDEIRRLIISYFMYPVQKGMNEETLLEFHFLKPDITILKTYQRTTCMLDFSLPNYYLNTIDRFLGMKQTTRETYQKGNITSRSFFTNCSCGKEFIKKGEKYNTGHLTHRAFDRKYRNALALTKERRV